jgi:hypothetical protein
MGARPDTGRKGSPEPIDASSNPAILQLVYGKHYNTGLIGTIRMLKKSASFVLASLKGSTYDAKYDSPLRSLRPCWTAFLSILLECSPDVPYVDQSGVELFLDPLDLCL